MIRVSPTHSIHLPPELHASLERPPQRDYVVRRLSRKLANGEPLIEGELVISGNETLEAFPRAVEYPLHFRKTYYPTCFHQDPKIEFENHQAASEAIGVPEPIGYTRTTFRSCFIPGIPLSRLSPFGVEPEERNIRVAEEMAPAAAIGLWGLVEAIYHQVLALHAAGLAHGDLFLHNVIVAHSPIGAHLIDFEQAVRREDCKEGGKSWDEVQQNDFTELLRVGVYLKCALGDQRGDFADAVRGFLDTMTDGDRFARAIKRHSSIG